MNERDNLGPLGEHLLVLVQQKFAGVVHRDHAELGAGLLADDLPGDDVGVVLHGADEDFVTSAKPRAA